MCCYSNSLVIFYIYIYIYISMRAQIDEYGFNSQIILVLSGFEGISHPEVSSSNPPRRYLSLGPAT
jgi:hypothetical protein